MQTDISFHFKKKQNIFNKKISILKDNLHTVFSTVLFFNFRWEDVDLKMSSDGLEYLIERQTKTRIGANIADVCGFIHKMFATIAQLRFKNPLRLKGQLTSATHMTLLCCYLNWKSSKI